MFRQSIKYFGRGVLMGLTLAVGVVAGGLATAATVPESADPIVLGKLDWTGQEITAEVAGEILRRMGYNVQFVQTTQVPMFQAVADGQLAAYLEQWNQTSKKYYDEYTKDGRVEGLGPIGLDGQEGWYYPDYVAEKCPGLPDWRALKACAAIFSTPDTAPQGARKCRGVEGRLGCGSRQAKGTPSCRHPRQPCGPTGRPCPGARRAGRRLRGKE